MRVFVGQKLHGPAVARSTGHAALQEEWEAVVAGYRRVAALSFPRCRAHHPPLPHPSCAAVTTTTAGADPIPLLVCVCVCAPPPPASRPSTAAAASPDLLAPVGLRLSCTDTNHRPHRPGFASSPVAATSRPTSLPYSIHRSLSTYRAERTLYPARCASRRLLSRLAVAIPASTCSAVTHAAAVAVVAALNHLMHRTHRIATLARSPAGPWPGPTR